MKHWWHEVYHKLSFVDSSLKLRLTVRRLTQATIVCHSSAMPMSLLCIVYCGSIKKRSETICRAVVITRRSVEDHLTKWRRCWPTSVHQNIDPSTHSKTSLSLLFYSSAVVFVLVWVNCRIAFIVVFSFSGLYCSCCLMADGAAWTWRARSLRR